MVRDTEGLPEELRKGYTLFYHDEDNGTYYDFDGHALPTGWYWEPRTGDVDTNPWGPFESKQDAILDCILINQDEVNSG